MSSMASKIKSCSAMFRDIVGEHIQNGGRYDSDDVMMAARYSIETYAREIAELKGERLQVEAELGVAIEQYFFIN